MERNLNDKLEVYWKYKDVSNINKKKGIKQEQKEDNPEVKTSPKNINEICNTT